MSRRNASHGAPKRAVRGDGAAALGETLAELTLWLLVLSLWWVHDAAMKDAFRLPKLLVAQPLALISLFFLSWRLWASPAAFAGLWRRTVPRAVVPLVVVASLGLLTTAHPLPVADALASLWIGAAALAGWNLGLGAERRERLTAGLILPAVALAAVGLLQYYGLYRPFDFAGETETLRLGVTSFAGSAGDLAMFLVLPCLVAQQRSIASRGLRRALWGGGLLLCLWALAVTQTLSALIALVLASVVLWLRLLPRRRVLAALAATGLAVVVLVLALSPLRERVAAKGKELARGDVNALLTGRLDGWRAALHMTAEQPLAGVGHGAYRTEFADAKLELAARGVEFFRSNRQVMFANAHNEYLEAAAEWGLPGALALGWGLWVVATALRRRAARATSAEERAAAALALAGTLALAVLALAQFPFRIALVGYQALIFLAWALPRDAPGAER